MKQQKVLFYLVICSVCFSFITSCEKEVPAEKIFQYIEITKLPDRTAFQLGETPIFSGMEVSEVYTDRTKKTNVNFETNWSADIFKRGKTKVTVSARGRSVTFDITFEGDLIDTGLPVVYLETENQQPVDSKENYVKATMVIKNQGDIISEKSLRMKGRGNATWSYPKKPYKLKLDKKESVMGMKEAKDWVLLANYTDKTLMRTGISLKLSRLMNFPWTCDDRFVEVVLNGEYIGNYQLVETVQQGVNRVDIPDNGYLFERDNYYELEPNHFETSMGFGYSFKNPDPEDDLTPEQRDYIINYMNDFEAVLASSTFNDPENGYVRFIDVESFIRWFLFQPVRRSRLLYRPHPFHIEQWLFYPLHELQR